MKRILKTNPCLSTAVILFNLCVAASGFSKQNSVNTVSFAQLFSEATKNGPCKVSRASTSNSTFYVPSDPKNKNARFNILGWGNGTATSASTYKSVLETIASQCILVAAANTSSAGSGKAVQSAVNTARSRYAKILLPNAKVCTAGHSQGGGGSFNAANLLKANCVIPVQADTVYTSQIRAPLASQVEVIALWGSSDTISPADPSNLNTLDYNSSILTSIETHRENHFTITSGRGGNIGTLFRMAALAQLSADPTLAKKFRAAFWGPTSTSTVTTSFEQISNVERDSGAINTKP